MCPDARARAAPRGFALPAAVFLLVILSALAVYLVSVSTTQQMGSAMDIEGAKAYQAARAGIEWGAYQVMLPQPPAAAPACPATTTVFFTGTLLAGYTSTVTCASTTTDELGTAVTSYRITATACNQPAGAGCPNPAPGANYVERQLTMTTSR